MYRQGRQSSRWEEVEKVTSQTHGKLHGMVPPLTKCSQPKAKYTALALGLQVPWNAKMRPLNHRLEHELWEHSALTLGLQVRKLP